MITTLAIIAAVVFAGAIVTFVGTRLIEHAHRPRGHFIEVGGFPQHVLEMSGNDAHGVSPVVVLHGASANLEDMRLALAERFGGRRQLVFVDRPGMGFSARGGKEGASPAYQAAVLRDVLDRLGVAPAILVAHSWAGALALSFALDFPERTAGLVLVAPATHPGVWRRKRYSAVLAGPLGWLYARTLAFPLGAILMWPGSRAAFLPQQIPERYVRRSAAMLVLRPPSLMANWADVGFLDSFLERQIERYRGLTVPTIILAGDRDLMLPPASHAEKLAAAAPNVTLMVLPGFGHMLHHAAPDRVVAAVEAIAASSASF